MGSMTKIDFNATGDTVIKPIALAHVVLRTSNFKKLREFYLNFLGARVQHENDYLCFITYDEEHHRIALIGIDSAADKVHNSNGLEHIAFSFATLPDLFLAYRQRLKLGIKPVWCVNHGPTVSMYYRDPDGNMLETQVDAFKTAEEANEFMMGKEFAENPIGVDFDPEDMIARIEKCESEASLMKRPDIGPRGMPPALQV